MFSKKESSKKLYIIVKTEIYTCISIHNTLAENVISKIELQTDFLKIYIPFLEI
jgi:hypothetical protein